MKTLVIILHYNSIQYTDVLYECLKPYEKKDYDLLVFDNGSDYNKKSKYNTHEIEENCYYGGGLDIGMDYFISNKEYDSLLFLNSDLIIHGYNFIKNLREQLFSESDLMGVSGCILQPDKAQNFWPQMHCWNSNKLRYVPFVDYQCVLLKREFIEYVGKFGSKYGWVQDIMTGIICEKKGWKLAVCDWAPLIHFTHGSIKDNSHKPEINNYNNNAYIEMYEYFRQKGLLDKMNYFRQLGLEYKFKK